jgi:hypothetical protein
MTAPSLRTVAAVLAAAAVLPAASMAASPAPRSGAYAGTFTQAGAADGKLAFKLGALSKRVVRISGTAQLTCADGTTIADSWDVVIYGPKVTGGKSFAVRADGIVLAGHFTSSTGASGTLERQKGDCSATGLRWTAKPKR